MANYTVSGTYSQTLYAITITAVGNWIQGSSVVVDFTTGTAPDGQYDITTGGNGSFVLTSQVSTTTSGNCILTVTGIVPKIASDIQKLYAGKLIDLFELDATSVGGTLYRFHSGLNELGDDVVWQGNTYIRFPIEVEGLEISGSSTGPPARPTIKVSNYDGLMGSEIRALEDLITSKLTRRRTFVKYLDAVNFTGGVNASADPNAGFPDEVWFVDRKSKENAVFIEFELVSALDITGVMIPHRQCIQNTCTWKYKSAECGWIPVTNYYFTKGDAATTLEYDSCGKRLSSCKARFGQYEPLPYGAFPGVGLF